MARISIQETLAILKDEDRTLSADAIRSLSDISAAEMVIFSAGWESVSAARRELLLNRLVEASETNFDLTFSRVGRLALMDPEEAVRGAAIEALWYDETPALLHKLMDMVRSDPAEAVRAEAMSAVGRFILLGELGQISARDAKDAQDLALAVYNLDEDTNDVRRRAVEALGNCTREGVSEIIQEAYESDDLRMRASAVHAMGSSSDNDWADTVLEELRSDEPEMRYEAVRAAGELQLTEALPVLSMLLGDDDREILEMTVSALGEIGGGSARHLLEDLHERAEAAGDDELVEAVEEALETASLAGEDLLFED